MVEVSVGHLGRMVDGLPTPQGSIAIGRDRRKGEEEGRGGRECGEGIRRHPSYTNFTYCYWTAGFIIGFDYLDRPAVRFDSVVHTASAAAAFRQEADKAVHHSEGLPLQWLLQPSHLTGSGSSALPSLYTQVHWIRLPPPLTHTLASPGWLYYTV